MFRAFVWACAVQKVLLVEALALETTKARHDRRQTIVKREAQQQPEMMTTGTTEVPIILAQSGDVICTLFPAIGHSGQTQ